MARIRAVKDVGGRPVTIWTPAPGPNGRGYRDGRPPDNAIWQITISLGKDSSGRYRQRSERLRGTLTQARARAEEMEHRSGRAKAQADAPSTFGEAVAHYIDQADKVRRRAGKTLDGYRSLAKAIAPTLGKVRLARLRVADIEAHYAALGERGLSPTTIHHHHALVRQTINMCVRLGWLPAPGPQPQGPELEQPAPYAPLPEDLWEFITAWYSKPWMEAKASALLLAGITGCRRGEVCAWRLSDFAPDAVVVRRAISHHRGGVDVRGTKTDRERRLAVALLTAAIVDGERERYEEECSKQGWPPDPDAYVFSDAPDHSSPLLPNTLTQAFGRLRAQLVRDTRKAAGAAEGTERAQLERKAARLAKVQLKHFRSFSATQMAAAGIDPRTASGRLGHTIEVYSRHYAAMIPSRDEAAAAQMEALFVPALPARLRLALPG